MPSPMKIGDLAKQTGLTIDSIRFYEKQGLLPVPPRTEGNYRLYGHSYLERLKFISHCRSLDMSLPEIAQLLEYRDNPYGVCDKTNALVDKHLAAVREKQLALAAMEQQLMHVKSQCSRAPGQPCGIIRTLDDESRTGQ